MHAEVSQVTTARHLVAANFVAFPQLGAGLDDGMGEGVGQPWITENRNANALEMCLNSSCQDVLMTCAFRCHAGLHTDDISQAMLEVRDPDITA